jgi:hypothetical protein
MDEEVYHFSAANHPQTAIWQGLRLLVGSATRSLTYFLLANPNVITAVSVGFHLYFRHIGYGLLCPGYSYCTSCCDYQALMPRTTADQGYQLLTQTGYDVSSVCGYCIENLNSASSFKYITICVNWRRLGTVTAAGRGQLRTLPLSKLRKYVEAYNIKVNGAIEKDDYIDHIIRARVWYNLVLWGFSSNMTSRARTDAYQFLTR